MKSAIHTIICTLDITHSDTLTKCTSHTMHHTQLTKTHQIHLTIFSLLLLWHIGVQGVWLDKESETNSCTKHRCIH